MPDERPEYHFEVYLEGDRSVRVRAVDYVFANTGAQSLLVLRDAVGGEVAIFKQSCVVGVVRDDLAASLG